MKERGERREMVTGSSGGKGVLSYLSHTCLFMRHLDKKMHDRIRGMYDS